MKPLGRYLSISTFAAAAFALTGCAQVDTARQWWQAWRNPAATVSPSALSSSKVTVDLAAIAAQHPAWKLAEQLENAPPGNITLNWSQPEPLTESTTPVFKSTFISVEPAMIDADFAESEQIVTATNMEALTAQMAQEQQAAWEQWEENISSGLEEDRQQMGRAMRVDLNDRIEQTQKNIPEIGSPFIPSPEIQREMINLRLKLLNNLAITAEEKLATEQRLLQLEERWAEQLRQQAQQGAENQRYWRETVPRQMREAGQAEIQQVLQTLQVNDQQTIDLTIDNQLQRLQQDDAEDTTYFLTLPSISNRASRTESTFRAPQLSAKSIKTSFDPLQPPTSPLITAVKMPQREIEQLKQVALAAAKRAVAQSALRHHWEWSTAKNDPSSTLPDATNIVIGEANF